VDNSPELSVTKTTPKPPKGVVKSVSVSPTSRARSSTPVGPAPVNGDTRIHCDALLAYPTAKICGPGIDPLSQSRQMPPGKGARCAPGKAWGRKRCQVHTFAHSRFTRQPNVRMCEPGTFSWVIMHIPEPRKHLIRFYGWYSNLSRGKRRLREEAAGSACPSGDGQAPSVRAKKDQGPDARAMRRSWAQLIKRIYEVDPLVCPSCGSEMKVVAFITEHEVVDKILRHLERTEGERGRGPPRHTGLAAVS